MKEVEFEFFDLRLVYCIMRAYTLVDWLCHDPGPTCREPTKILLFNPNDNNSKRHLSYIPI